MDSQTPQAPRVFQAIDRGERAPYSTGEYARRFVWNLVRLTIWRLPRMWSWRGFLLRAMGARVGKHVLIHASAHVYHPWLLEIGEYSVVGKDARIYNLGPVRIGSHTVISQGAYVCAGTHDYTLPHLPLQRPPIVIGSGVWIAAEAFIGPGVTIGDNTVIGARAVVMKDVPPGVVVGGNPARVIKPREMRQSS
jgi:putative colanic acid biosynthesis acetyltransferase WcaF